MTTRIGHPLLFAAVGCCGVSLALWSAVGDAAVVRGRLTHVDPQTHAQSPAAGISVTVMSRPDGATAPIVNTSADGMYYIYNVKPGGYYLEVWSASGSTGNPIRYPIDVSEPLSDIPVIQLP